MFITPYFGGCKYTNNFLFINKNPVFQCFGLLITPSASHFTFSSSLHILQNFFLQSPIPFRLRILLPLLSLFILHDTPSKLRPFLQVFRNSCHLFPAKTATAIHKSDKFLYIWELQDKISRNILQNPNRQNYGNRPEMDCCPY